MCNLIIKDLKMSNKNSIVLNKVELMWPFLGKPNNDPNYGSGKYEVTVLMTKEQAEQIEKAGLSPRQKIKEEEDGRKKITLKSTRIPFVCDMNKVQMSPEQMLRIGNGSIANIRINMFDSGKGIFAGIGAMKITELKEYAGSVFDGLDGDEVEDTFSGLDDDDDV